MATKKKGLPEISINEGDLLDLSREAHTVHAKVSDLQTQEKTIRGEMADVAEHTRLAELSDKGKFVGMIRVTGDNLPPVRIEFRNSGKCLDVGQEEVLDDLFGAQRPLLFERAKVVTEILDPEKVISDLKAAGKNPWDFIKIDIKNNQDEVVASNTSAVKADEGFIATKDLLATLDEISDTLSPEAREYIEDYLHQVLKPTVVLGTNGKKG